METDATEVQIVTRWALFKKYVKTSPLIFWPLLVIIAMMPVRIYLADNLLVQSLISMVTVIAMGTQWIGICRQSNKRKADMLEFDMGHLESMMKLNNLGNQLGVPSADEFQVKFLADYKPKRIRSWWHKLRKTRILSLYNMGSGRADSFTKVIVTEKEWFFLQLKDCINTTDAKLLQEGLAYLSRDGNTLRVTR